MEVVGRYRLLRHIKQGGVAEVYEAQLDGQYGFQRRFALKRPLAGAEIDVLVAFADEALVLSHLDHPGIVSVIEFGSAQGWPFQALEYVDGFNLSDLHEHAKAAGVPVGPAQALRIVADAARALDYAHRAEDQEGRPLGIVHREVSPKNILVSKHGQVKVIDFGIARSKQRMSRTAQGIAKGHLLFMAPERFEGRQIGPYTDVFSLGCVLHALLAGESPFEPLGGQEPAGTIRISRHLEEDIARIVATAVRRNPRERFASARDMASACLQSLKQRGDLDSEDIRDWMSDITSRHGKPVDVRSAVPQARADGRPDVEMTLFDGGPAFDGLGESPVPEKVALLETLQRPLGDPHEDRTVIFNAMPEPGTAQGAIEAACNTEEPLRTEPNVETLNWTSFARRLGCGVTRLGRRASPS